MNANGYNTRLPLLFPSKQHLLLLVARAWLLKTSLVTNSTYLSTLKTLPPFPPVAYHLCSNEYQEFMWMFFVVLVDCACWLKAQFSQGYSNPSNVTMNSSLLIKLSNATIHSHTAEVQDMSPRRLNSLRWSQIFDGRCDGTFNMSPRKRRKFWKISYIFRKICAFLAWSCVIFVFLWTRLVERKRFSN